MKRFTGVLLAALLLGFLLTPCGAARADSQVWVHFVVVSKQAKAGLDNSEALNKLQSEIAKLAGGYTYLGNSQGGYLDNSGALLTEGNHSYIISAPRDVSQELEKLVKQYFGGSKPFILVWQGKSNW